MTGVQMPRPGVLASAAEQMQGSERVSDVIYVGLTIVVFAVLFLILKGIESFER